jgi:ComF family protein
MREVNLLKQIINILYPRRCPICGNIVLPRGELACPACRLILSPIEEPRCKKCSKPIESEESEFCLDCNRKNHKYVKGFALWVYDGHMKKSISDFKFHGRREYSEFYVTEIVKRYREEIKKIEPDVLVPIPIHSSKQIQRGYNQADILAKGIGKEMDLPVLSYLLQRNKKTLPQKQLNDKERLKNLEQAFQFSIEERSKYPKEIRKVILVDDIYTTGSTIEACTNKLIQCGIEEVYFISICIGKGY